MSKGPGRIQRAVAAIFAAEPDNAFLTIELCERIYGLDRYCEGRIDNRFRIALIRAAKKVPGVEWWKCRRLGGELVFFNSCSLMSRGMAEMKGDDFEGCHYRNRDHRLGWTNRNEKKLRAKLLSDRDGLLKKESGIWFATEIAKARARGDDAAAAELDATWRARIDAVCGALKKTMK